MLTKEAEPRRTLGSACPTLNAKCAFRMGHPFSCCFEKVGRGSCYPGSPNARDLGHLASPDQVFEIETNYLFEIVTNGLPTVCPFTPSNAG